MTDRIVPAAASICLGVFAFSLQDVTLKALSGGYPVTQAMLMRSLVAFPLMLAAAYWAGSNLRSRNVVMLALRALCSFCAYLTFYLSIAAIPLADAVALNFASPLVISALAVVFLRERLRAMTVAALVLGLIGVAIAIQPGSGAFEWASLLALASACFYGASQVLARYLGPGDDAVTMSLYQNGVFLLGAPLLALAVGFLPVEQMSHPSLTFLTREWVWPTLVDGLLMGFCGVAAAFGSTMLSQGYRLASAGRAAVFEYSAVLWAPLWGLMAFNDVPGIGIVIGGLLICGAGMLTLWDSRVRDLHAPQNA
jgi:drug/metabolite transporter (DMT)-like permease